MEKKSLALIGAGRWGKNLARNFYQLGALHSICDKSEKLLEENQTLYPDVQVTSDFDLILENPEILSVAIASPAVLHYQLTKQALLANKDVYVEKPLSLDSKEGEELIALAKSLGKILMVGHLLQYHPCVETLQKLLKEGELGKLQYIVSNRLNLGCIRTEENSLWSFAPHDVSVILSLCGNQQPETVRCVGGPYLSDGVADTSMTTMKFADGVRAHIYVSWLNPFKEQKLVVVGSNGMAVFDDRLPWKDKLTLYRNHITWLAGSIPLANKGDGLPIEVEEKEPLKEECSHFLDCCRKRETPRTDGKEGLRVMKLLQAAQKSLDEDGEAKNPEEEHNNSLKGKTYYAHSTAVIDKGAIIGEGSKVWHFSHLMGASIIGKGCNIGQNVLVSPKVWLGSNVKVQNNVSLYSGVICEDDVFLGPSMVFTNINNPRSEVVRKGEYIETRVRKGATIGANATVVCGNELGEYSFIGAGAVVTKPVKPYALIVGNPGKQMGWMSRYGIKLDLPVKLLKGQVKVAKCPESGEIYELQGDTLVVKKKMEELTEKIKVEKKQDSKLEVAGIL